MARASAKKVAGNNSKIHAQFIDQFQDFLDMDQLFELVDQEYGLWKLVLDKINQTHDKRIQLIKDVISSGGLFLREYLDGADTMAKAADDLVFMAVALVPSDCNHKLLLFDAFTSFYKKAGNIPFKVTPKLLDYFFGAFQETYGQGNPESLTVRIKAGLNKNLIERLFFFNISIHR